MDEQPRARITPGVIVLQSSISSIDAANLRYRGIAIEELVEQASYEQVAWLLLTGSLPSALELTQISADLAAGSNVPEPVWEALWRLPPATLPVARMQTALPVLGQYVPALSETSDLSGPRRAMRLLGAFAVLAGSAQRAAPLEPPDTAIEAPASPCGVACSFLTAMRGRPPQAEAVRALEQVLILYADHELNASTFTGRVAASTRADLVSSVLAALCALRGPLHGGVDRFVRAMLAAAEQEGVENVLERYVRAGMSLPGFGHAVYRAKDPRAVQMQAIARRIAGPAGQGKLLELTEEIEATAAYHGLPAANVDLYTVVVYRSLGIPDALSTLVFATGRLAGWCAHILEQYHDNRLIRPRAAYIGPEPRHWPSGAKGEAPAVN